MAILMGRSEYIKQIYFHFWPNKQGHGKIPCYDNTPFNHIQSVADLEGGPVPQGPLHLFLPRKFQIMVEKF
jgi:hypothetical protein